MLSTRIICFAVLTAVSVTAVAAQKSARRAPLKTETLACRLGTEDRHARIAVVLKGGKTDSFAYYSKWKPRTCSIYLQRERDPYSRWSDSGNLTTVNLERGAFLIEHGKGEYHFIFRDVDRERYCGMDGVINGSLTIRKGKDQCELAGSIMEEGVALGEANKATGEAQASAKADVSPVPAATAADAATPAPQPAAQKAEAAEQPGAAAATAQPAEQKIEPVGQAVAPAQ